MPTDGPVALALPVEVVVDRAAAPGDPIKPLATLLLARARRAIAERRGDADRKEARRG
jgi:hypothetical protein